MSNSFLIRILFGVILFIGLPLKGVTQGHTTNSDSLVVDSKGSLGDKIKTGKVEFHLRSFFMGTHNKGMLTDYHTNALGAGIGYYSPSFKGFQFGFSGFFVFQLYAHNLNKVDPSTGNINRYEVLLYDMNNVENTKDLDRLEDLYLSYQLNKFKAVFGRQKINTPLLNEQDNRMRPNIFNGLTLGYETDSWKWMAAWYNHVTMRGTVNWYSVENSFGVYPFGRNVYGTSSGYKGNISSKGIGVLGAIFQKNDSPKIQVWNYLAENVFLINFIQADTQMDLGGMDLLLGAQGFHQAAINHGGNSDPELTFMMRGEKSAGFGAKVGLKHRGNTFSINYLGISDQGRFLFPREWGRENFFASLSRERFEGNGGVTALTAKYEFSLAKYPNLNGLLGASSVNNPDIDLFSLNKYGVPSYYHFAGALDYSFHGYLDGMKLKFLLINKTGKNNEVPDKYRINRVDLWNLNIVVDYKF
ncbi:OprD family outer membrane porin [Lunatibacter salilacus]|uniref:OprD family outer membrane porin n=1 Tax=Lunatibacter salilacus TaxID=2483804 RepID=UPI00131ABEB8|nr:OprD family outer membrane porin [Lunatibacter salilacus]